MEGLVEMCIDAASASRESVEIWRRQRRTLERLPAHLADALLRRLLRRRLLYPSLLESAPKTLTPNSFSHLWLFGMLSRAFIVYFVFNPIDGHRVFQRSVEEVDLKGENSVDAEWMAYLGAFRYLRSLNLAGCRGINNSALWPVSGMTSLKELDLSRCSKITDVGIRHLLSISSLEKLCISETGLSADGVVLLASLRKLRVLDMGGIPVTDRGLCSLQVLTELEHLDIWGSEVSNVGSNALKMFSRLSFLNLAWTNVTKLPYLPSITCLNMSNCNICSIFYGECSLKAPLSKLLVHGATFVDIDGAFSNVEKNYIRYLDMSGTPTSNFHFFDNMKGLEHLDLSFSRMNDELIRYVAPVGVNLTFLNLSNTKITSQGIGILVGNIMNLETLLLSHTAIDDVALSYIGMVTSLRSIDLSHTQIKGFLYLGGDSSDKTFSLDALLNLSHLESLNLEETQLREEALYPLCSLRGLKSLYLKSDFLSDSSLHASSSLQKLKHLGFRCAVVSNSGLLLYRPPPALCSLDLLGCWLLSADIVSTFCRNHPTIEVKHEHIETLSADQNGGVGSSPFRKTSEASLLKQKGERLTRSRNRFPEVTFVDERIRYAREELLELQLLPLSRFLPCDLPQILRKE